MISDFMEIFEAYFYAKSLNGQIFYEKSLKVILFIFTMNEICMKIYENLMSFVHLLLGYVVDCGYHNSVLLVLITPIACKANS